MKIIKKIYDFIQKNDICFIYGGAMSGKSYTVAQYIILEMLLKKDLRIFVFRKYTPSVRISSWRLFLDLIKIYSLSDFFKLNQSFLTIEGNGNILMMRGLDDSEKIKSVEADIIWFEEATEFKHDDFVNAILRLRRKEKKMILTFNPIYVEWIVEEMRKYPRLKVNFNDNPFLREKEKEILFSLKGIAKTIYLEGEFAKNENLVFTNFQIVDDNFKFEDGIEIAGVDFGFVNPTAVVFIEVNHSKKEVYVKDEIYMTGLTNTELIEILKNKPNVTYFCDSSEPQRIKEIQSAGIKVIPSIKTKVSEQIKKILEYQIFINSKCKNLLREMSVYSWKKKNDILVDEIEETSFDHAIDALRYAVFTSIYKSQKIKFFVGRGI